LSTTNLSPLVSKRSSLFLGSSRAIAKEGPAQPPELRKIRMGEGSCPWK
jgi:hypothetical protein